MFYKVNYLFNLFLNVLVVIAIPFIIIRNWKKWNTLKDNLSKRTNKIMSIIGIIFLLGIGTLMIPDAIDYCKDIPAFITKDYRVEVGAISDSYREGGKARYEVIVVNGLALKGGVHYKDRQKYSEYKFYYLLNTHWIMTYSGCE